MKVMGFTTELDPQLFAREGDREVTPPRQTIDPRLSLFQPYPAFDTASSFLR